MAESMLTKFNSYWANVYVVMAITNILDPRYRMKLLEFVILTFMVIILIWRLKKLRIFVMICLMSMEM